MKKISLVLFIVPLMLNAQPSEEPQVVSKIEKIVEKCTAGNCKNGTGTMTYETGVYVGAWRNGLRDGKGTFTWTNGDIYKGQWLKDKRHGAGEYVWTDGSKYRGNYSGGIRSGFGIYYYTNGTRYEGTWQNNVKHGIANYYNKQSVNFGGKYVNNEYVQGTGVTQEIEFNRVTNK